MGLFGNFNKEQPQQENTKPDKMYKVAIDIFERYYIKVNELLKMRNVPSSRMPSREHLMSQVFSCINEEKFSEWLGKYAEITAIKEEVEEEKEIED